MTTFDSFMKGYKVGDEQRQALEKRSALINAQQIYAQGGDATPELRKQGMFDEATQYEQLGQNRKKEQLSQTLGQKLNTGDIAGAQSEAYNAGEIDLGSKIGEISANMSAAERAKASETMNWLGQNVVSLKSVPPQGRLQAALDMLNQAGMGGDQKAMAALQQAAADGKITDEEIDRFRMSALDIAEQFKVERGFNQDAERVRTNKSREQIMRERAQNGGDIDDDENLDAFPDEVIQ